MRLKPFGFLYQATKIIQTKQPNFITEIATEVDGSSEMFGRRVAVVVVSTVVRSDWTNCRASYYSFR